MLVAQELSRLAQDGDVIVVRNAQPGLTVFEDVGLGLSIRWEAAGDPNGGDVLEVSATALKNPEFRLNVLRGVFVIEEAPEALNEAVLRIQQEWSARGQQSEQVKATISRPADRRVAKGKSCIAPKGQDLCGTIALASEDHPPLCTEHMGLTNQYVQVEGPDGPTWRRRK